MNFRQALDRIGSGDPQFSRYARHFLYGNNAPYKSREPNKAANEFLSRPCLQGDNFNFSDSGGHGFVIGNDKLVVKFLEHYRDYYHEGSIRPDQIPEGLAAEVMPGGEGFCNDISFLICERLNTKPPVTLEEVISHLFKERKQGVIYWDPQTRNYGRDEEGIVKALDHSHFKLFDAQSFAYALKDAIHNANQSENSPRFPVVFSDNENTYIVLSKEFPVPPEYTITAKQAQAVLDTVGIDTVEKVKDTSIWRIPMTKITYGQPPHERPLAEYIQDSFETTAEKWQSGSKNQISDPELRPTR